MYAFYVPPSPYSSFLTPTDARALCQAAGSLQRLILSVKEGYTSQALEETFDHRPLQNLDLILYSDIQVCSHAA